MTATQKVVVALVFLSSGYIGWIALSPEKPPSPERRVIGSVEGPEGEGDALQAEILAPSGGGARAARSEVEVNGRFHGAEITEVVFRSQESPDMLRLGWVAPGSLVISVPQYPQDAGKPVGADDPSFVCAARALHVQCEAYSIGPRR